MYGSFEVVIKPTENAREESSSTSKPRKTHATRQLPPVSVATQLSAQEQKEQMHHDTNSIHLHSRDPNFSQTRPSTYLSSKDFPTPDPYSALLRGAQTDRPVSSWTTRSPTSTSQVSQATFSSTHSDRHDTQSRSEREISRILSRTMAGRVPSSLGGYAHTSRNYKATKFSRTQDNRVKEFQFPAL